MTYPAKVTTPFPTVEETAKILGVPLTRARQLSNLPETSITYGVGAKKRGFFTAKKHAASRAKARKARR